MLRIWGRFTSATLMRNVQYLFSNLILGDILWAYSSIGTEHSSRSAEPRNADDTNCIFYHSLNHLVIWLACIYETMFNTMPAILPAGSMLHVITHAHLICLWYTRVILLYSVSRWLTLLNLVYLSHIVCFLAWFCCEFCKISVCSCDIELLFCIFTIS